jgi:hypothetical protein
VISKHEGIGGLATVQLPGNSSVTSAATHAAAFAAMADKTEKEK